MGAQAVIVSIVVVEMVERSPPVQLEVFAAVSWETTSGNVCQNEIMVAAESHVAIFMAVEVTVSPQLAPEGTAL